MANQTTMPQRSLSQNPMTDQITDMVEGIKAQTDPELHSDLDTVVRQANDLQAQNEQLREKKESLQTELKKTTKGTLVLASELEARYQTLFENAVEGIYTTSEHLEEYLLTNPAFVDLLGYESGEALCSAVDSIEEDVFVDPDRYAQFAETLHADGEIDQFEYQVQTADGEVRWISDSVRALTDDDGVVKGYRGAVIDITKRKTKQRNLERQTNLGIVLNRVLRHNLRNDISVIRGHTQLMADKLDNDTYGKTALSAIDRLIELTEKARLLDEIVADDSEPELADISALIEGIVSQIRGDHPSATISLASNGDEEPTAKVLPSFKRAIQELIENAIKHSADEAIVEVTIEANPDDIQIRLADNGPGINDQELSVLESGAETPLLHGSGLGLWLTNWIVTSQGGVINATANEEGTTLSVVIPRTTVDGSQKQLIGMVRARDQYKSAFEEAGDGMTITDDEGRILDVNSEAAQIFGVDEDALIGRPIREFLPEEFDFEAEWGEIQAAEMKRGEVNIVSADGGVSPIEYTAKSNIVPGQHLIVSRDITERKEREQELELAETVFQTSQDALVVVDVVDEETFLIKRVNEAYKSQSGRSNTDVVGKTPQQVLGEEAGNKIESRYRECVERRETIRCTEEVPSDKEPRFWETRLTPLIQDGEVTQLVGVGRDITGHEDRDRQ